jgi:hypothetical protein
MGSLFSGNLVYVEISDLLAVYVMQSKSNITRCSSSSKPGGTSEDLVTPIKVSFVMLVDLMTAPSIMGMTEVTGPSPFPHSACA